MREKSYTQVAKKKTKKKKLLKKVIYMRYSLKLGPNNWFKFISKIKSTIMNVTKTNIYPKINKNKGKINQSKKKSN